MSKEVYAWAIQEKQGGRKGKLVTLETTPLWHPIKTAVYRTRGDALRFIKNTNKESLYEITRIKIKIEKVSDDECNNA